MFVKESEDNAYTCKHAHVKCCLATQSFSKWVLCMHGSYLKIMHNIMCTCMYVLGIVGHIQYINVSVL